MKLVRNNKLKECSCRGQSDAVFPWPKQSQWGQQQHILFSLDQSLQHDGWIKRSNSVSLLGSCCLIWSANWVTVFSVSSIHLNDNESTVLPTASETPRRAGIRFSTLIDGSSRLFPSLHVFLSHKSADVASVAWFDTDMWSVCVNANLQNHTSLDESNSERFIHFNNKKTRWRTSVSHFPGRFFVFTFLVSITIVSSQELWTMV